MQAPVHRICLQFHAEFIDFQPINSKTSKMNQLKDKIILVTGASRGLGNAVAKELINQGAKIIAVARNLSLLEKLDDYAKERNNSITIVPLDLNEFNKIDELGFHLFKRFGQLDGLISSAASFGVLSPLAHISPDIWRKTMSLNLEANWRLIRSLDPLLKAAKSPSFAIFISSPAARELSPYYGAYAVSKAALEALVTLYNNELKNSNVSAKIFTPPAMSTDMRKQEFPGRENENLQDVSEVAKILIETTLHIKAEVAL